MVGKPLAQRLFLSQSGSHSGVSRVGCRVGACEWWGFLSHVVGQQVGGPGSAPQEALLRSS